MCVEQGQVRCGRLSLRAVAVAVAAAAAAAAAAVAAAAAAAVAAAAAAAAANDSNCRPGGGYFGTLQQEVTVRVEGVRS